MTSNEEDKDPDIELFVKVSMTISLNVHGCCTFNQQSGINTLKSFLTVLAVSFEVKMGPGQFQSRYFGVLLNYFFLSINTSCSNSSVFKCLISSAAFCGSFALFFLCLDNVNS